MRFERSTFRSGREDALQVVEKSDTKSAFHKDSSTNVSVPFPQSLDSFQAPSPVRQNSLEAYPTENGPSRTHS